MAAPVIRPFGEAAVLVDLGRTDRVHALAASLRASPPLGVLGSVPGIRELLVELDPVSIDPAALAAQLEARAAALISGGERASTAGLAPPAARHRSIPVAYGGAHGPDLDEVARLTGIAPDEVIRAHAGSELTVMICGFAPGFAYLGDLPAQLEVPRLATPRTRTPAGSVAIGGRMSGVYPADLPGGWRVIGRTPITLFDPRRDPPTYLAPGDRVRFEVIDAAALPALAGPPGDW